MISLFFENIWVFLCVIWSKMFGKEDKREFANSITQKEREVDKFHPNDLLILHGSSEDNSLLIALSIQEKYAHVNLILQLNGVFYKHTGISAYYPEASSTEITIDGFRIEIREAFRRMRITFRGCLAPEGSNDLHFVHLQSNWAPVSDGIFIFHDMPSKVKAKLMAEKVWSNKIEINPSYYQFGVLRLRWKIDEDPWHEGDFRGCRIKFSSIRHDYYLVKSFTSYFKFNGERSIFFEIQNNDFNVQYGKVLNSDHTEKDVFLNPLKVVGITPVTLKFNSGVNLNVITGILDGIKGNVTKIFFENGKKIAFSPKKQLEYIASTVEKTLNVVSFFNFCCLDSNVSGGKASNLARLCGIQKDFKVPKGLAVTVAAYEQHLIENQEILEFVNSLTSSDLKADEIEERANRLFLSSNVSVGTNACLRSSLEDIFDHNLYDLKFAVRSSAVGEDGAEMSSAGQLESYLNLTIDEVIGAVLKCWASNFRKEVVTYRREHGQDLNVPVAVVVQEMVTEGISGVMFTVDPVSLNPNQIVINIIEGCGEDLVSGHKTPTQIIVSKSTGDVVKQIGPEILTSDVIKNLASVSKYLESHFDHPQDIEFVIKNAAIYIVQSRNITNLHNESDWELFHEFDSALLTDYQIGCTANVGEVMNLPFSPMDSSTIMFAYTYSITSMIHHLNSIERKVPRHPHNVMFLYKNKVFLDAMECYLRDWDNISKDAVSQINLAGTRFVTEEMVELARTRFPRPAGIEKLKTMYRIYKMINKDSKEWLEKMKDTLAEMKLSVHGNDLRSWVDTLNVLADYLTKLVHYHAFESAFSNVAYVFVAMLLRGTSDGDLSSETLTAIASVYSNNPYSIISGEIPISLKSIALLLKADDDSLKILNSDLLSDQKVAKLKEMKSEVGINVRGFFQKHGHRGHHELLLLGVTYNEDAESFIQTLKTLLSDPNLSPQQTKPIITDIGELIDSLNLNITGIRRQFLKYMIPNAFRAIFYREEAKNWLVDGTNVLRTAIKNVGKVLVKQRYIPDEKLIFFLTMTEIRELVNAKDHVSSALSSRARRRLRVYNQHEDLQYPLVFIGTPKPKETFIPQDDQQVVLRGTAVCEGKVKGRARVAKTFAEAQNISSDEILITVCTDIAWSPLFPVIKGLVTEIGGLLSHGAVVAREYGLPCVIAVEGATNNFTTGDHVLLDAFNGTIQRVPTTSNGLTPP